MVVFASQAHYATPNTQDERQTCKVNAKHATRTLDTIMRLHIVIVFYFCSTQRENTETVSIFLARHWLEHDVIASRFYIAGGSQGRAQDGLPQQATHGPRGVRTHAPLQGTWPQGTSIRTARTCRVPTPLSPLKRGSSRRMRRKSCVLAV
eukprot:6201495-Pleurochrysis_carterae.AAC.1